MLEASVVEDEPLSCPERGQRRVGARGPLAGVGQFC